MQGEEGKQLLVGRGKGRCSIFTVAPKNGEQHHNLPHIKKSQLTSSGLSIGREMEEVLLFGLLLVVAPAVTSQGQVRNLPSLDCIICDCKRLLFDVRRMPQQMQRNIQRTSGLPRTSKPSAVGSNS